jgi:hypothetical protein
VITKFGTLEINSCSSGYTNKTKPKLGLIFEIGTRTGARLFKPELSSDFILCVELELRNL